MRIRALITLVLVTFGASACSSPPAQSPASSGTVSDAPRSGSIFFWRASKEGKAGSVFLLGSIHMRKNASLDRAITEAATQCERGVFELDSEATDPTETIAFIRAEGMLKDQTLKDVVSPEVFASWAKAVDESGLPRAAFEKLKPWMAAFATEAALLEKRGITGRQGVDVMLEAFERQEPSKVRKIIALETALEQLRILGSASAEVQEGMLRDSASSMNEEKSGMLFRLYEAGDEVGITELNERARKDPKARAFTEAIYDRRNVRMTEKVVPMFDMAGCTVVTVGLGHIVGESGIARRLRDQGFVVERVASRGPTDSVKMAYAVPKPREFVSREDGFSVRTPLKPMISETPAPGLPGNIRTYEFVDGLMHTIVNVAFLGEGVLAKNLDARLEEAAVRGLTFEGMKVTGTERILVHGEKGILVRGVPREAQLAESVWWVHGDRLYEVTAKIISGGDSAKLENQRKAFLESFQYTP